MSFIGCRSLLLTATAFPTEHKLEGTHRNVLRVRGGVHPILGLPLAVLSLPGKKEHRDVDMSSPKGWNPWQLGRNNSRTLQAIAQCLSQFQRHIPFHPALPHFRGFSLQTYTGVSEKVYGQGYKHCKYVRATARNQPTSDQKKIAWICGRCMWRHPMEQGERGNSLGVLFQDWLQDKPWNEKMQSIESWVWITFVLKGGKIRMYVCMIYACIFIKTLWKNEDKIRKLGSRWEWGRNRVDGARRWEWEFSLHIFLCFLTW